APESRPIVSLYRVERVDHRIEIIGHDLWRRALPTIEHFAEIIETLAPFGFAPDERVRLQPQQRRFLIEIVLAAQARGPGAGLVVKQRRRDRRIPQGSPFA